MESICRIPGRSAICDDKHFPPGAAADVSGTQGKDIAENNYVRDLSGIGGLQNAEASAVMECCPGQRVQPFCSAHDQDGVPTLAALAVVSSTEDGSATGIPIKSCMGSDTNSPEHKVSAADDGCVKPSTKKKLLESFIDVVSQDDTTVLNWPLDMVCYTVAKPSISYCCNPLHYDFRAISGLTSQAYQSMADVQSVVEKLVDDVAIAIDGEQFTGSRPADQQHQCTVPANGLLPPGCLVKSFTSKAKVSKKHRQYRWRRNGNGTPGRDADEDKALPSSEATVEGRSKQKKSKKKKKKKAKKKHKRLATRRSEEQEPQSSHIAAMQLCADYDAPDIQEPIKRSLPGHPKNASPIPREAADGISCVVTKKHKKHKHKKKGNKKEGIRVLINTCMKVSQPPQTAGIAAPMDDIEHASCGKSGGEIELSVPATVGYVEQNPVVGKTAAKVKSATNAFDSARSSRSTQSFSASAAKPGDVSSLNTPSTNHTHADLSQSSVPATANIVLTQTQKGVASAAMTAHPVSASTCNSIVPTSGAACGEDLIAQKKIKIAFKQNSSTMNRSDRTLDTVVSSKWDSSSDSEDERKRKAAFHLVLNEKNSKVTDSNAVHQDVQHATSAATRTQHQQLLVPGIISDQCGQSSQTAVTRSNKHISHSKEPALTKELSPLPLVKPVAGPSSSASRSTDSPRRDRQKHWSSPSRSRTRSGSRTRHRSRKPSRRRHNSSDTSSSYSRTSSEKNRRRHCRRRSRSYSSRHRSGSSHRSSSCKTSRSRSPSRRRRRRRSYTSSIDRSYSSGASYSSYSRSRSPSRHRRQRRYSSSSSGRSSFSRSRDNTPGARRSRYGELHSSPDVQFSSVLPKQTLPNRQLRVQRGGAKRLPPVHKPGRPQLIPQTVLRANGLPKAQEILSTVKAKPQEQSVGGTVNNVDPPGNANPTADGSNNQEAPHEAAKTAMEHEVSGHLASKPEPAPGGLKVNQPFIGPVRPEDHHIISDDIPLPEETPTQSLGATSLPYESAKQQPSMPVPMTLLPEQAEMYRELQEQAGMYRELKERAALRSAIAQQRLHGAAHGHDTESAAVQEGIPEDDAQLPAPHEAVVQSYAQQIIMSQHNTMFPQPPTPPPAVNMFGQASLHQQAIAAAAAQIPPQAGVPLQAGSPVMLTSSAAAAAVHAQLAAAHAQQQHQQQQQQLAAHAQIMAHMQLQAAAAGGLPLHLATHPAALMQAGAMGGIPLGSAHPLHGLHFAGLAPSVGAAGPGALTVAHHGLPHLFGPAHPVAHPGAQLVQMGPQLVHLPLGAAGQPVVMIQGSPHILLQRLHRPL